MEQLDEDEEILLVDQSHAETPFFHVEWNDKGQFISIYDKKADRELLPAGEKGNVIMSYEDRPHNYDAWDINHYYTEKAWEVDDVTSVSVEEQGPVVHVYVLNGNIWNLLLCNMYISTVICVRSISAMR